MAKSPSSRAMQRITVGKPKTGPAAHGAMQRISVGKPKTGAAASRAMQHMSLSGAPKPVGGRTK